MCFFVMTVYGDIENFTIVCKKSLKELGLPFNDSVSLGQSCSQKRKKQSSIKINHKKPKKN